SGGSLAQPPAQGCGWRACRNSPARRREQFCQPVFSISTRNSLFPAGPSSGDSVTPRHVNEGIDDVTNSSKSRKTRACTAGSVITPSPLSASSLPASNCGLTSATILPEGFSKATALGKIFCNEINEQSITARSAGLNGCGKFCAVNV